VGAVYLTGFIKGVNNFQPNR